MINTKETVAATNIPALPIWMIADSAKPLGHCIDAVLVKDESGGYVATVAQLRGVVSEGDDLESAIRNLKEAFRATLDTYSAEGMPIPWREPPPRQSGETYSRVAVNV